MLEEIKEVYAYRMGRHYRYYGVTRDKKAIEIMSKAKKFYGLAYEFENKVRPCEGVGGRGAYFIFRGKPTAFTSTPIRIHVVQHKGEITNELR